MSEGNTDSGNQIELVKSGSIRLEMKQAQRRAAGDRSRRKYSKISITKSVNFGPLGPFCPF